MGILQNGPFIHQRFRLLTCVGTKGDPQGFPFSLDISTDVHMTLISLGISIWGLPKWPLNDRSHSIALLTCHWGSVLQLRIALTLEPITQLMLMTDYNLQ